LYSGDKRETAKNIGLACNLIDPDMESSSDLLGSLDIRDMNRVIEITGDWVSLCASQDRLRAMFDLLDSGGDVVDGVRTGYISRQELQLFLIGMRVPGMDDDRMFDAQWIMANSEGRNNNSSRNVRGDAAPSTPGGSPTAPPEGRIGFQSFCTFIRNLKPSHLKAVQTDIELGLRKARLIAGDGTDEEKRDRLEKCPISLVVEGEAFSVFFPSAPKRNAAVVGGVAGARPSPRRSMWERFTTGSVDAERRAQLAEQDSDDFGSPEVLLLRETFFELASMAKSVICCRLTPSQKGRIVEEFGRKGAVTLAIGDGGNDELMIKRASIGVGITGLEGTAASRASDYAIGQVSFKLTD
jgi:magnesium-transporting ATPase (P-type)